MKKLYRLLLISAFVFTATTATASSLPYYTELGDTEAKGIDPDWTIVDRNNDGSTWAYDNNDNNLTAVTGAHSGIKYQYNSKNAADDWAVSPAFSLTAGTEYLISFWLQESRANTESLKMYIAGAEADVDAMAATDAFASYDKNIGTTWRLEKHFFTPGADGDYRIAFRVCSAANQYNLLMRGFTLKENKIYPAAPSGLTVTPDPDKALQAELSWTLPATDENGNELTSPIESVSVSRNGEPIAELDGDATSYTDTDVPEPGTYTYDVTVTLNGATSLPASVRSSWIGPKRVMELPYEENFTDVEYFTNNWTIIDVDGDATDNSNTAIPSKSYAWCWESTAMKNKFWPTIYAPRNSAADENDWLLTPPLRFEGAGKYRLSLKATMYSGASSGCALAIYAGTDDTPEAMTIPVGEIKAVTSQSKFPSDGTPFEFTFDVPSGDIHYIGFHSTAPATGNQTRQLSLGAIKAELVELSPTTGIAGVAAGDSAPERIYRLDGTEADPRASLAPGIYISVSGTTARKIAIK